MYPQTVGVITYIKPGMPASGGQREWFARLTVRFVDDQGNTREEDFPCKARKAADYRVGDSINLVRVLRVWHIHPSDRE